MASCANGRDRGSPSAAPPESSATVGPLVFRNAPAGRGNGASPLRLLHGGALQPSAATDVSRPPHTLYLSVYLPKRTDGCIGRDLSGGGSSGKT